MFTKALPLGVQIIEHLGRYKSQLVQMSLSSICNNNYIAICCSIILFPTRQLLKQLQIPKTGQFDMAY